MAVVTATEIPQHVLDALRIGKPGIVPEWALIEAGKCLGVLKSHITTFQGDDSYARERVINALDAGYPGWRGYIVQYVDGSVG